MIRSMPGVFFASEMLDREALTGGNLLNTWPAVLRTSSLAQISQNPLKSQKFCTKPLPQLSFLCSRLSSPELILIVFD
jgi:hypothetical protein